MRIFIGGSSFYPSPMSNLFLWRMMGPLFAIIIPSQVFPSSSSMPGCNKGSKKKRQRTCVESGSRLSRWLEHSPLHAPVSRHSTSRPLIKIITHGSWLFLLFTYSLRSVSGKANKMRPVFPEHHYPARSFLSSSVRLTQDGTSPPTPTEVEVTDTEMKNWMYDGLIEWRCESTCT